MSAKLQEAKSGLERVLAEVKGISGAATTAGRDLTPAEQTHVKALMAEAHRMKAGYERLLGEEDVKAQIADLGKTIGTPTPGQLPGQPGAGGFKARPAARSAQAETWSNAFIAQFGAKGLTIPSGSLVVPAPTTGIARMGEPPRFIADLIPSREATGSSQPYFRQSVRTNAAAAWGPTGTKPESDYGIERPEAKIATVAHVVDDVQRNDLADAEALSDFIREEMFLGLRIATDDELLNGDGVGPSVEGLLETSGIQSQTFATDKLTTLRKALTKLELAYAEPSGLVLHPNDAEALDLTQDDQGRFYFAGPQASGASPVWSVPVVHSAAIAEGVALMGDFQGSAVIFQREEARLDFTEALGFKENTVTFRAELRMGLGVLRPLAFVEIDLTP